MTRAGIYTRISQDDGSALGVERQRQDCVREAEKRGWAVVETFTDNNVSATKSKVRPEYQRMLQAVKDGKLEAVVVWDVDRLTRTPAELEGFIDLADKHSLALASVGGEIDLATPQGRLTARIKGSVAKHEVEQLVRRVKRKNLEKRQQGEPHGVTPFGYRRVDGRDVVEEVEAAAIRELYRRVVAGESLRSLAKYLNAQGFRTARGNEWVGSVVGRLLQKPRYVGDLTHRGEVVGPGNWRPIIDRNTFDLARAILSDPNRTPSRGRELKYLGSGLYRCGRAGCGAGLRPVVYKGRAATYGCPKCMKLQRLVAPVDEAVEVVIVERLSRPNLLPALVHDNVALEEAVRARDAILVRMDGAADQYADGKITARQFGRINERLRTDLEHAEAAVRTNRGTSTLASMAGPGASEAWAEASLERKRAVIRELAEITVLPSGPGIRFSPEQVRFDWKVRLTGDTPNDPM